MSSGSAQDYKPVGLAFTKALVARDYSAAYALTSTDYRDSTSVKALQAAFEGIIPDDWKTVGPIEVGATGHTAHHFGLLRNRYRLPRRHDAAG